MTIIATPCVNVCRIDQASRLCTGCGRTLEEIARWRLMPEADRLAVMAGLEERIKKAGLKLVQAVSDKS